MHTVQRLFRFKPPLLEVMFVRPCPWFKPPHTISGLVCQSMVPSYHKWSCLSDHGSPLPPIFCIHQECVASPFFLLFSCCPAMTQRLSPYRSDPAATGVHVSPEPHKNRRPRGTAQPILGQLRAWARPFPSGADPAQPG